MALRAKPPRQAKLAKPKIMIFGASGVGKTFTSMDFPSTYLMDAENGASQRHYLEKLAKSGGGYWGREDGAGEYSEVLKEFKELAQGGHPYKTAILDSHTKLFNTLIAEETERLERAKKEIAYGNEKRPAVRSSRRMITLFDAVDMNVIIVCHEKAKWGDNGQEGYTYDGWEKLRFEMNLVLRIVNEGGKRKAIVDKSRFEQFPEYSKFDWSYDNFADIFGRDVLEGEVKATQFATDEQIQEFNRLISIVKVSDEVAKKWDAVESLSDLTSDALQKRIDYLNNQLTKGNK